MSGTSEKLEVSVKKETKKEKASKAGRGEGSGKTVAAKTEAEPRRNRRGSSEQEEVEESASNNKDGSDDEAQFTEMEEEQPSRKRLKGTNGRARPSETGDLRNERSIMVPTVKVFQRDAKDGYLPGSIVRICCEHFLTYDFVEFSPGPHMNMILGPNGTGKSTIACAICIGLGFSVSVLGRAEVLTAFVKHGYDKGFVEIELKGPLGKPNVVIRRNITTMSNASTWTLNGKNSNKRTIEDKVADLGIQVSNLCSFLPQDRVQEFAKLKPEELLAETQKVAGHPRLKQWHDQLKELGTSLADIRGALVANQQDCATEEGKNQLLERDVVIFNKRKKLEEDLSYYEILVPWYKFKLNKGRVKQCKLAYRQAGIKLANARAEFEPATRFKERLEGKLQTLNRDGSAAQDAIKDLQKKVERLKRDDKRMSEQYTEIQDAIVTLSRDDQESKVKIQRLESDIRRFKDQLREHKGHSETDTTELIAQK
ncbi:Structural maintenance of chromosomes protein 5, partial [Serendipita sp. 405]